MQLFSNYCQIDLIIINLYLRWKQSGVTATMRFCRDGRQHEMFALCAQEVVSNFRVIFFYNAPPHGSTGCFGRKKMFLLVNYYINVIKKRIIIEDSTDFFIYLFCLFYCYY